VQANAANSGSAELAPKQTWAQMFAKPPATIPPKVASVEPTLAPEPGVTPSEISSGYVEVTHEDAEPEDVPVPPVADEVPVHEPPETPDVVEETAVPELTPSKDQLTVENVEHLPDTAQPAPTGTAASTVESSRGPDSVTPSVAGQPVAQLPIGRPQMGGFQTTAYKATGVGGRSASFQRRIMQQEEAVVMPGNHAVDRTAVQFGSLGLNGDALDVDEDREEAETRTQPPQHSPVAQPRASLPPVPRQPPTSAEAPVTEAAKQSTGLPPAPQQQQPFAQQSPNTLASQTQPSTQATQGFNQFGGRYGQANAPSESPAQKQYDPFSQQAPQQQSAFDSYPTHTQAPNQQQQPTQSQLGGFSSAANDYSSYYTSGDQRSAYQNYYNTYSQQNAGSQQDAGASQPRTGSAFGATADTAFPTSQTQQVRTRLERARSLSNLRSDYAPSKSPDIISLIIPNTMPKQAQSRYGEAQQSGHTTPNPALGTQQQTGAQTQQAQQMHQQPHGQGQHGAYPYGAHPYYNSPYFSAYMNQYAHYNQPGFGGQFGKGGMYNQPHPGYSMGSQNAYDQHSSSPANAGGFNRDSVLGSGLGDYGRSGSTQPSQTQQTGSGAFGGVNDPFGRSQSGFPGQNQPYGQQQSGQQISTEDSLKPFGESKPSAGPSPSALGQSGRPGSATNTTGQGAQTGLPPPQSHQQGFSGYPGHLGQMGQTSQYGGGLGGLGGHTAGAQSHQGGGYGGGYGSSFGNSYGSYNGRGGWGGNYGH
jgi:hypothetical protein